MVIQILYKKMIFCIRAPDHINDDRKQNQEKNLKWLGDER